MKANHAAGEALILRTQDAETFNAWFAAYLTGNKRGQRVAQRRFRNQYDVAFRAWLATIESLGWELFHLLLDVASGRRTWAEHWKLHNALVLFNPAPVT